MGDMKDEIRSDIKERLDGQISRINSINTEIDNRLETVEIRFENAECRSGNIMKQTCA